jgi:hypothetical protein
MVGGRGLIRSNPLACLLLFSACSEAPKLIDPDAGAVVDPVPLADATVADGEYFPSYLGTTDKGCSYRAIANPPILRKSASDWYSSQLRAAGERPLTELAAGARQQLNVRFVWLRSFDKPMIVRIQEQPDGRARIEAKRLSGAGGYEPGEVEEHLVRDLAPADFAAFAAMVKDGALATEAASNCDAGIDGARWVLEVIDGGKYSFFERWTPEQGGVRDVGLAMLRLTGFDLEPIY